MASEELRRIKHNVSQILGQLLDRIVKIFRKLKPYVLNYIIFYRMKLHIHWQKTEFCSQRFTLFLQ